jgi:hypothetical protein
MPQVLKDLFASKKFLGLLVGVLGVLVGKIGWEISDDTLWQLVALVASFITGQGIADFGKSKALIESNAE